MVQLFKHTFSRLYLFYQDVLNVKRNTHYYASFVLALLMFANVYTVINGFTLLAYRRIVFDYRTPFFILAGNALVFTMIVMVSMKQRYKVLTAESQTLSIDEKKKLNKNSNAYVIITLVLLLGVLLGNVLT